MPIAKASTKKPRESSNWTRKQPMPTVAAVTSEAFTTDLYSSRPAPKDCGR